ARPLRLRDVLVRRGRRAPAGRPRRRDPPRRRHREGRHAFRRRLRRREARGAPRRPRAPRRRHGRRRRRSGGARRPARREEHGDGRLAAHVPGEAPEEGPDRAPRVPRRGRPGAHRDLVVHAPAVSPDASLAAPHARRLEVAPERLIQDWKEAHERARAYLAALDVPEAERDALAAEAVERALDGPWDGATEAVGATLAAVRRLVLERSVDGAGGDPDEAFRAWRLARASVGSRSVPRGAWRSTPGLCRRSKV